jgi:acetyltransferase-like isoleucine patch superfamily enzyme
MFSDNVKRGFLARIRKGARPLVLNIRRNYLNRLWGMDIAPDCMISFEAKLDKTYPRGVHIGQSTAVNFGACILTHDYSRNLHLDTRIGRECQIGAHSIILPGITIGDHCVVAIASVVIKDVPPNSLVAGHPARIIERDIQTGRWGKIIPRPPPAQVAPSQAAASN